MQSTTNPHAAQDPPDSEWTQVSIPNLNHLSVSHTRSQPFPFASSPDSFRGLPSSVPQTTLPSSATDPVPLLARLVPGANPNQVSESDSSTTFDAQAWKRGDSGTGRRARAPSMAEPPRASFVEDAAFMPVPAVGMARRRRAASTRRASKPHLADSPRPTSDLGPHSQDPWSQQGKPTWRAYTAREPRRDDGLEFLQALANLRAMAGIGQPGWRSGSSGAEDEDADEPRPMHADLPTSAFNSAADEDEEDERWSRRAEKNQDSDVDEEAGSPHGSSWWERIENAVSLKTIQLVGLGGLIFGIGIIAGSLIGRKIQRSSRILDLFSPLQFTHSSN